MPSLSRSGAESLNCSSDGIPPSIRSTPQPAAITLSRCAKKTLLSRGYGSGATPRAGAFAYGPTKRLIEVRLVCKPAINRNLRKRHIAVKHQTLRALHSTTHHIGVRRFIEALTKRAAEVKCTQLGQCREVRRNDFRIQVHLNVSRQFADLPRRQAAPRGAYSSGRGVISFRPGDRGRRSEAQQRSGVPKQVLSRMLRF